MTSSSCNPFGILTVPPACRKLAAETQEAAGNHAVLSSAASYSANHFRAQLKGSRSVGGAGVTAISPVIKALRLIVKENTMDNDKDKFILDACCGAKYIWFDKNHPNVLYMDINKREKGFDSHRPNFEVNPDIIGDFRKIPCPDSSFKLVIWDPPQLIKLGKTSSMGKRYGVLNKETWPYDLSKGFEECWRVLEDYGVLIFKWNCRDIPLKKVLKLFKEAPLFGHKGGSRSQTRWMCFMKIPK